MDLVGSAGLPCILPVASVLPSSKLDILSWDATDISEPENAGVRITRRALIVSSTKATTGAPIKALSPGVSLHIQSIWILSLP
jgi:hypothetical protein